MAINGMNTQSGSYRMCNVSGQIIIKAHEKGAEAPFIIFHDFLVAVTINSTQRFTSTMLAPVGVESKRNH